MIVSDSTSLIHLSRIGRLDILKSVFGKVFITNAVYNETVVAGKQKLMPDSKNIEDSGWITRKNLSEKQARDAEALLKTANTGLGEAESIILSRDEKLSLIIDDSIGVRIASTFGIETYWTTSVILNAVSKKIITQPEAKEIIENLITTGYRLKPEIVIKLFNKLSE